MSEVNKNASLPGVLVQRSEQNEEALHVRATVARTREPNENHERPHEECLRGELSE